MDCGGGVIRMRGMNILLHFALSQSTHVQSFSKQHSGNYMDTSTVHGQGKHECTGSQGNNIEEAAQQNSKKV